MPSIKENYNIAPQTTFKIGGPVRYYVTIDYPRELKEIMEKIQLSGLPYVIVGNSSNILFDSAGFPGWVLRINISTLKKEDDLFRAGAGLALPSLIQETTHTGYAGLHSLVGIPGSVGGAVRGNAGAHGAEIGQFVQAVKVFNAQKLQYQSVSQKDCRFRYRGSIFVDHPELVLTEIHFVLEKKDRVQIKEEMIKILENRSQHAYASHPSAGSIFKNIDPQAIADPQVKKDIISAYLESLGQSADDTAIQHLNLLPAGFLLERAGLKGTRIGQAKISEDHANIILNLGEATSDEVHNLIQNMKEKVRNEWGIELEEEVVVVGKEKKKGEE